MIDIDKIALILAAGKGKRMKSDLPKVLHKLNGRYIVEYVIDAAREAGLGRQILVIGHQAEMVEESAFRLRRGVRASSGTTRDRPRCYDG